MPVRAIQVATDAEVYGLVGGGLLTPSMIIREALIILENNLMMANRVNRKFEDNNFVKTGSTLIIKRPNRWIAN